MGISCASKIFTEQIIVILIGLPGQLNMTDDILVFGRSKEEHHRNLMNVLARLEDSDLTLNKRKCEFYKTELTFYGLKFSAKGVSATEDRRKTMMEFPVPVDAKELKSFLCSMLWSSRFITDFCQIAEPLWELTRDALEWKWSGKEQKAFDGLKLGLSNKSLGFFNTKRNTELTVDARPTGLGGVLVQYNPMDRKDCHKVANASRLLTDVERRYSQCEKRRWQWFGAVRSFVCT